MAERSAAWMAQAQRDLQQAAWSLKGGFSNGSVMPVSISYLDGQATIDRLRELALVLVSRRSDVKAFYLFGSLAQNRHVPGSDADLLIVLVSDERRVLDRIPEFLRAFLSAPVPVDVFPYTVEELKKSIEQGNLFVRCALSDGLLLAGTVP
jgi:predicted nucleotidyltransferase